MSYSILYRSMFLRLSDNTFIPVVEAGDNNVYEAGNGRSMRRARSWNNGWFMFSDTLSLTRDEIVKRIDNLIEKTVKDNARYHEYCNTTYTEQDVRTRFDVFSCLTVTGSRDCTATRFRNFWLKGFDYSVDFDFCKHHGITVALSYWTKEGQQVIDVDSEQELRGMYELLTDQGIKPYVNYRYDVSDYVYSFAKAQHNAGKPKKAPQPKTSGYVVSIKDYGYVTGMTPRRMQHSSWLRNAHIYSSVKAAQAVVDRLKARWTNYDFDPTVKPVSLVDNSWVLTA